MTLAMAEYRSGNNATTDERPGAAAAVGKNDPT